MRWRPPRRFVDEMRRGPFAAFRHVHHFDPHGEVTAMRDVVDYRHRAVRLAP